MYKIVCNVPFSDPNMLNEINWSKQLEEVFKDNRKSYPEIYWQSFGSQKGMLRIYPLARLVLDYKNNVYAPSLYHYGHIFNKLFPY